MPRNRKYKVGDDVMGKYPGQKMYYPAKVVSFKGDGYEVEFADNVKAVLKLDSINPAMAFTAKKKSPSRSTSRGRNRKTSRSRSRSPNLKTNDRSRSRKQVNSLTNTSETRTSTRSRSRTKTEKKDKEVVTPSRQSIRIATLQNIKSIQKAEVQKSEEVEEKCISETSSQISGRNISSDLLLLLLIVFLTAFVPLINLWCDKKSCTIKAIPKLPRTLKQYVDVEAVFLYLGWLIFHLIFTLIPIGKVAEGHPSMKSGRRPTYRLNGFLGLCITAITVGTLKYLKYRVDIVFDKFFQFLIISMVTSYLMSVCIFLTGAKSYESSVIKKFFMGSELNPRLGNVDLKLFLQTRVGYFTWALLNMCILWREFEENSNSLNFSVLLVSGTQLWYVFDAMWFEEALLTTWNFTTERLGFMLIYGYFTFVPFVFSIGSRYVFIYRPNFSLPVIGTIFLLYVIGYVIYRGSNSQKDEFRRNPFQAAFANKEKINTDKFYKLLADGYWGWLRHPNYLGDLIIGLSWCLATGFQHIIPYTYIFYLAIVLIHRTRRVEKECERKYGVFWSLYIKRVPHKIFPHIF